MMLQNTEIQELDFGKELFMDEKRKPAIWLGIHESLVVVIVVVVVVVVSLLLSLLLSLLIVVSLALPKMKTEQMSY